MLLPFVGGICFSVGAALTPSAAVETDEKEAPLAAGSSVTDGSLLVTTNWPLFACFFLGTIIQAPSSLLSTAAGQLL